MDVLYYYLPFLETIRDFFELGGPVLRVIGILTLFMWMLVIERLVFMRTGYRRLVRSALQIWENREDKSSWKAHQIRSRIIAHVSASAEKHLALIQTCVALCPLLGLLGTVTGMIEVFEVMAISGSGNPRSMASGVSKATVPTMSGMVAALSGVAMSAYLSNRARREREALADHLEIHHQ
ncbi:MotA/TolQ/ExbB proton channel family protein [Elongatibacter sediminis]|uniref:MotA/TolQ/ExbB proton channel family protein n=1 Tax=Elongatibacter sediminis TaxID=3119006 RepID=A0AAW9RGE4_9GAMM